MFSLPDSSGFEKGYLMPESPKLKIFVASTVYGFQDQLDQICAVLTGFGYAVYNSHLGTVAVDPARSNRGDCLAAVASCDLFLGIIRPSYGSGVVGERSITHEECLEAMRLRKPRWFLVHHDVTIARTLLRPYLHPPEGEALAAPFIFKKTAVLDDIRIIDLYEDTLQTGVPVEERMGHWVQEFYRLPELLRFLDSQFKDTNRIRTICKDMSR